MWLDKNGFDWESTSNTLITDGSVSFLRDEGKKLAGLAGQCPIKKTMDPVRPLLAVGTSHQEKRDTSEAGQLAER